MTDMPPPAATSMGSGDVAPYPARLEIAYPDRLNRVTTAFRLVLVIPIAIVAGILTGSGTLHSGSTTTTSGGITGGLFVATLLLILFRQRYPRWWFDFALEFTRFTTRIGAYFALLTDNYPSTVEHQTVALDLDYPDVERDLNRGLPLVKWFLAIPPITSCSSSLGSERSSPSLSPGSPSCSRAAIPERCLTTLSASSDGDCASRPTRFCPLPIDTRRSPCVETVLTSPPPEERRSQP